MESKIKYYDDMIKTILDKNISIETTNKLMLDMIVYLDETNKTLLKKIDILEYNNKIILSKLSLLENKDDYDVSFVEEKWKNTILSKCNLKIVFYEIKHKSLTFIFNEYSKLKFNHNWITNYIYSNNGFIDYIFDYYINNLDERIKKQEHIMTYENKISANFAKEQFDILNKLKNITNQKDFYYDNKNKFYENIDIKLKNIFDNKTKNIYKTFNNLNISEITEIITNYKSKILLSYSEKTNNYYIFNELMEICEILIDIIEYLRPDVLDKYRHLNITI
jgi:hypothetical protein